MIRVGRPSPVAPVTLPPLDGRVELAWAGCNGMSFRSRVEEEGPGVFAVLAPLGIPAGTGQRELSMLTVTWQSHRGVHRLPCELLAVGASGAERLWWVSPSGPISVLQRRQFVRVPAALSLCLDGPCGPCSAVSVDISEGGLGCQLTGHKLDPWVFNTVTIPINDRAMVTSIKPVRVGVDQATGQRLLGAGFVDLGRDTAVQLRRHVYARQILLRRMAGHAG